jgi:hypothetical protein
MPLFADIPDWLGTAVVAAVFGAIGFAAKGGIDVATAVAQPRWFVEPEEHFAPPDTVRAEPRFRAGLLDVLQSMGHTLRPTRIKKSWRAANRSFQNS